MICLSFNDSRRENALYITTDNQALSFMEDIGAAINQKLVEMSDQNSFNDCVDSSNEEEREQCYLDLFEDFEVRDFDCRNIFLD